MVVLGVERGVEVGHYPLVGRPQVVHAEGPDEEVYVYPLCPFSHAWFPSWIYDVWSAEGYPWICPFA